MLLRSALRLLLAAALLLASAPTTASEENQPPRPNDLSAASRFVPFYDWYLTQRPDESEVVMEAYRVSLGAAADDLDVATTALQNLETRLETVNTCVDEVQDRLVRRLAEHDPEALLPLLDLHRRVWIVHTRQERIWLAEDTLRKLLDWTEIYTEAAGSPEARAHAGRLLLVVGDTLRRVQIEGFLEDSTDVLAQALNYLPNHPTVLYAQSLHWELLDRPERALEMLEAWRAVEPDDPVLHLHLARILARTGQNQAALRKLETLRDPNAPEWLQRLAVQERVRLLDEAGRSDAARAELETGLNRFLEDPRLQIALAARDRLAGAAPPGDTALLLDGFLDDPGPSPRLHYEAGPYVGVRHELDSLKDAAAQALPRFVRALEHDRRSLWEGTRQSRSLRRQARYSRCKIPSSKQLPELLR